MQQDGITMKLSIGDAVTIRPLEDWIAVYGKSRLTWHFGRRPRIGYGFAISNGVQFSMDFVDQKFREPFELQWVDDPDGCDPMAGIRSLINGEYFIFPLQMLVPVEWYVESAVPSYDDLMNVLEVCLK